MIIDVIITVILFAFIFTMLYCICLTCKKKVRKNRVMCRNIVTPPVEDVIAPTIGVDLIEKENEVRFYQLV